MPANAHMSAISATAAPPEMLRLVPDPPLSRRVPRESSRPVRLRAALPAADLVVAVVLSCLILRPWPTAFAYCVAAVPLIGLIEGYAGAPLGGRDRLRSGARLALAAIAAQWAAFFVASLVDQPLSPAQAGMTFIATVLAWCLSRLVLARVEAQRPERVAIVGSGVVTERLIDLIAQHTGGRMHVVGYLDDHPVAAQEYSVPRIGSIQSLAQIISHQRIDRVMVAFSAHHSDESLLGALRECDELGVRIDLVPRLHEYVGTSNHNYTLGSVALQSVRGRDRRLVARAGKRAVDVIVSSAGLVLFAPLFALIALLIKLQDRGPVLFAQERVGRHGEPFRVLKFRTMFQDAATLDGDRIEAVLTGRTSVADAVASIKRTADPRVTRIGGWLRRTSLDELPQLINVLRGEMSLVGPRPLRAFEVEALSDWELMRQTERPGLPGLWQVSGRSATSWDERMQLDYSYVRHWSLAEDIEILARTLPSVLSRDGAW